ncbi:Insulin-like growth factor 1 receptor [Frankliniella fusca]|uniref:Insulin-like growth factor 1 receptor n=1 Tax=Frankliniella fusca TaxID=407009 RepID=A0AAE1HIK1_9NEOP|nr:Insulin-like growth factor 1 receptor [Frankliniella fusca]
MRRVNVERLGEDMGPAVSEHPEKLVTEPDRQDLCATCHGYIVKMQVPPTAVVNGFRYPPLPPGLRPLTEVEEHVLALRLPFQQIYGVRGSVINVPTEPDQTVRTVIPLLPEEDQLCVVNIKRKLMHKRAYARSFVDRTKVLERGRYLQSSPLYREHGVSRPGDEVDVAPGENSTPVSVVWDRKAEELSFPGVYLGQPRTFTRPATRYQAMRSEVRRTERRGAAPQCVLYKYNVHVRDQASGHIRHKFKRGAKDVLGRNITREQLLDKEFVSSSQKKGLAMPCLLPNPAEY